MSTSARRKRSRRFYWAEIGFLVLGIIALKPEILTELIPTGRNSSQVAWNNTSFGNPLMDAGGSALFIPVSGTVLYPASYPNPTSYVSPTNYAPTNYAATNYAAANSAVANYGSPYPMSNGVATTFNSPSPHYPTQNVTSMMASTVPAGQPSGLQVVWPDSYRPIATQSAQNYVASNAPYLGSQYGSQQYGQYRGTPSTGASVTSGYNGSVANTVASSPYPQSAYPQSNSFQAAYPSSTYPSTSYVPNTYSTVSNTMNTTGGYRTTMPPSAPPVVGRY